MAVSKVTSGYSFELAAKAGGKLANIDIKDVCPVAEACLDATRIKVCIDSEGKVKKCS